MRIRCSYFSCKRGIPCILLYHTPIGYCQGYFGSEVEKVSRNKFLSSHFGINSRNWQPFPNNPLLAGLKIIRSTAIVDDCV